MSLERQALVTRLRELRDVNPEMPPPELADLFAASAFGSSRSQQAIADRTLARDFLQAEARNIIAHEFRIQEVVTRRGVFRKLSLFNLEAEVDGEDESAPRLETIYERISAWKEFSPNAMRLKPVLHFNFEDCDTSEARDFQQAGHYTWKGLFKRRLKARLEPNQPDQLVENVWSAREVEALALECQELVSNGNFRFTTPSS